MYIYVHRHVVMCVSEIADKNFGQLSISKLLKMRSLEGVIKLL